VSRRGRGKTLLKKVGPLRSLRGGGRGFGRNKKRKDKEKGPASVVQIKRKGGHFSARRRERPGSTGDPEGRRRRRLSSDSL